MPAPAATALAPRPLRVERESIYVEGHRLEDVVLGGWSYGPEPGTAPAVVIVGGITASPFPFGDGRGPDQGGVEAWWPSLIGNGLVDPATTTILCPCWPGNGSTWRGFDGPDPPPAISVLGLADLVAAWIDGSGCQTAVTFVGASLGGMVGVRCRPAPGSLPAADWSRRACDQTDGAPRPAICSASWSVTAGAMAMWPPA